MHDADGLSSCVQTLSITYESGMHGYILPKKEKSTQIGSRAPVFEIKKQTKPHC